MIWTGNGMLAMSKMNPERMNAGMNVIMRASWLATNWLRVAEEMSSPMPRATSR